MDEGPLLDKINSFATPPREVVGILRQLLQGLQAIHDSDIIHRDIKPTNILCRGGVYKLGNSDIAKMPDVKKVPFVTWKYVAPECLRGEAATRVSDIYSLGIVAYELLLGGDGFRRLIHRTWRGASSLKVKDIPWLAEDPSLSRLDTSIPWHLWQAELVELPTLHEVDASISQDISRVVAGMCRKKADERYASCRDILVALTSVMGDGTTELDLGREHSSVELAGAPHQEKETPVSERAREPAVPGSSAGFLLKIAGALILLLSFALVFVLMNLKGGDEDLRQRGLDRLAAGDYAGSASDLEAVVRKDPGDSEAALAAAKAEYHLTNYGAAEQQLAGLRESRPEDPEIFLYLGLIDLARERFGGAAAHLERAAQIGSGSSPEAHFYLGFAYFQQRSWSRSRVEFKRFLRLVPEESPLVSKARAFLDKLDQIG